MCLLTVLSLTTKGLLGRLCLALLTVASALPTLVLDTKDPVKGLYAHPTHFKLLISTVCFFSSHHPLCCSLPCTSLCFLLPSDLICVSHWSPTFLNTPLPPLVGSFLVSQSLQFYFKTYSKIILSILSSYQSPLL